MEASAVEPPAPVLISVVVVGKHANDDFVVRAGVVKAAIHVVDVASQMTVVLGGTNAGDQRRENTILLAVAVHARRPLT